MSISSESAEQMTRMMLQGSEVVVKVSGQGAVELISLINTILKNQTQTKGKTRLNNLLRSGKELKIFCLKQENLKQFAMEAKRYGVLYSALIDRNNPSPDGMVDIMVRAEDASKINRIVERFKFVTIDEAKVRTEIKNDKEKNNTNIKENQKQEETKEFEEKSLEERLADELINKPTQKEVRENNDPKFQSTEKKNQSEHSSKTLSKSEGAIKPYERKSVKQELKDIKEELIKQNKNTADKSKEIVKNVIDKTR